MNKDSKEYRKVREEIAIFLSELPDCEWNDLTREEKEEWYYDADLLLSIKGLAILADDKTIPDPDPHSYEGEFEARCAAQEAMEKAGFKKVIWLREGT